jgi:Domain of unknown function (DUF5666)
MNDHQPRSPHETGPAHPGSPPTSGVRVTGNSDGRGSEPPPSSASSPDSSAEARQASRSGGRRLLSTRSGRVGAAALMCAVIGLSAACGAATSTTPSSSATSGHHAPGAAGGAGSNARSGPAAGGSTGTVGSISTSSFTLSTSAGQKVTVNEASSTKYQKASSSASSSALATGESVLVLGTTSGTTITATRVIVQPTGIGGSAAYSPSAVSVFQKGSPSTAKQDGQIPTNYTEGSGTIVSGTAANEATEAALAAYPGGVVDRVVKLSNGEYEVHYIGVNWPHHIFVNKDFKVIGAN